MTAPNADFPQLAGRPQPGLERHHHVSLGVGGAQEDYEFHTRLLSLKLVKQTGLYDGEVPVYHLYYGNDVGEESTLVTCFPMRQSARKGRKGTGQFSRLSLSVPRSGLGFWRERLREHGVPAREAERFGERSLQFQHPCGVDYELVAVADDARRPHSSGEVPAQFAIRGTHSITLSVREVEASADFLERGWAARRLASEGPCVRYAVGEGLAGTRIDLLCEPDRERGSQELAEGIIHHCAFQARDAAAQRGIAARLAGLGFEDVSPPIDRGYFDSIYVREPSGALFEAAVSKPEGFAVDEPVASLGSAFQVPPNLEGSAEEIRARLEPVEF